MLSIVARLAMETAVPLVAKEQRSQLAMIWFLAAFFFFIGGIIYAFLEDWSFLEACYFTVCTLLTIGFGDFVPTSPISKIVTIFFIIGGLGVCATLVALLTMGVEERGEAFAKRVDAWYNTFPDGGSPFSGCCPGSEGRSSEGAGEG